MGLLCLSIALDVVCFQAADTLCSKMCHGRHKRSLGKLQFGVEDLKKIEKDLTKTGNVVSPYINPFSLGDQNKYMCKQCRSRWDGS